MKDNKKFGITVLSKGTGVMSNTIRMWEQRYQVFDPERSESGARLYSESDLKKAKLLASLIENGNSISFLSRHTIEELEGMMEVLGPDEELSVVEKKNKQNLANKKLLKLLLKYKLQAMIVELDYLRSKVGSKEFLFEIILPIMRETGLLVMKGKFSVTQEHIVSTIIRDQVNQLSAGRYNAKNNYEIILATPEGNLHDLSIMFADVICRCNRFKTHYFGGGHPALSLGEAVNAFKHRNLVLVLGVVSSDEWNFEEKIIPFLATLDKKLNKNIDVMLGGGSKMSFPSFTNIKSVEIMDSFEDFDQYLIEL